MTQLLQTFLDSPDLQALVTAAVVWGVVWAWKRVGKLPSGEAALRKRMAAIIASVLLILAPHLLALTSEGTPLPWGSIIAQVALAFGGATGLQALIGRRTKPDAGGASDG